MILAIDPGSISGAWAAIDDDGKMVCGDLPGVDKQVDPAALARLVRSLAPSRAVVERVASMPKQGVSSTFKFGTAYGIIQGVLAACGVEMRLVTPGAWKKASGTPTDKEAARALAIRTWPQCAQFERKKDHGRAEAALMARWGRGM